MKGQIHNLSKQMEELICKDTEKMLDISLIDNDLERLAGTLNRYNSQQRQTVASALRHEEYLKESVANISHDLRTPLTVILGHLQLLKKEDLPKEQENRVETILNKAERMKELIEIFYNLAVLDTECTSTQREKFNFTNLLINLITENSPALEQKNICPEINLPEFSVFAFSDRNMVERILQNLLTNAIRYTNGNIKINLEQQARNKICFSIENSVSNVSEIDVSRLFERFYMADKSRRGGGTGLGLAVVKALVEKLGGSVKANLQSDTLVIILEL
ncbi:sensor histidine kinase [uncultured Robinsoniella sp.]|uniref:sensor histidine kinase n=1 Tax=uncultured Robinsoniella sp. TaxID=904190 RepID=UPI00374ED6E6